MGCSPHPPKIGAMSGDHGDCAQPPETSPAPALRASDADRERVLGLLSVAAGDGRLSLEEYSARADRALAARVVDELAALTCDLERPAEPVMDAPERLVAILGNESRKGHWRVPSHLVAKSVLGDCHIDLDSAVLTSPVTTIEASATLGSVTIFVPEGVEVRLTGTSILGAKSSELRGAPLPGAPVIHVRARAVLGNVTVRPPKLLSRARRALLGG